MRMACSWQWAPWRRRQRLRGGGGGGGKADRQLPPSLSCSTPIGWAAAAAADTKQVTEAPVAPDWVPKQRRYFRIGPKRQRDDSLAQYLQTAPKKAAFRRGLASA